MTQVPPAGSPAHAAGDSGAAASAPAAPTPPEPSIGELAQDVSRHMSTLVRGEIDLAKAELRSSVRNAGAGVGMFIGAAVIFLYSLTFGFIALAQGLIAAGLWPWVAYLVVFVLLALVAAALVWLGVRTVKKVKAPERTIATAKETVDYLKHPTAA